jgi:hypothetical protein
MLAVYRLFKPLAFSFSLITRVLVLGRMLSLVSVAKSARMRVTVARVEVAGLLFAAASSLVSCVLMWRSTQLTFEAASSFSDAAALSSDPSSRNLAFQSASSADVAGTSASRMNELNNSFLLGFYSLYAAACVVLAAVVLQNLRAMRRNVDSQKLLLDEIGSEVEMQRLSRINDVVNYKAMKLRIIMRKVVLNCSVVVLAALFSLWIDSFSVAGGLRPTAPPPPCPSGAGICDECEQRVAAMSSARCVPRG